MPWPRHSDSLLAVPLASPSTQVRTERVVATTVTEVITPAVATAPAAPYPVDRPNIKVHLPYEFCVTIPNSSVMTITRVETLAVPRHAHSASTPKSPVVIATLEGAALGGAIEHTLVPSTTDDSPAGTGLPIIMDLTLPGGTEPPARHRASALGHAQAGKR